MQILPNVFLVNGFPYGQHQNSYVVRLGDEFAMIDSGDLVTNTFDLVKSNCASWDIHIERIHNLFITHVHSDHASHAAKLQQLGVRLVAKQFVASRHPAMGLPVLATANDL